MKTNHIFALISTCLFVLSLGCSEEDIPVTLRFEALINEQAFACGQTYTNLGDDSATFEPGDFRFYVHDVVLTTDEGEEQPLKLVNDGMWQDGEVALLDFEDGSAGCANGTTETRHEIIGAAADEKYAMLRFKVGLPFEKNHQDAATASSPLNLTAMFWNWNGGYKFIRLDDASIEQNGWRFHLGSTGCVNNDNGPNEACEYPNLVEVELDRFNPETDTIVIGLDAWLSGANLNENQQDTPPGCMSGRDDSDCAPLFRNLGLPWSDNDTSEQKLFRSSRDTI